MDLLQLQPVNEVKLRIIYSVFGTVLDYPNVSSASGLSTISKSLYTTTTFPEPEA
jgi:hypothetical protein